MSGAAGRPKISAASIRGATPRVPAPARGRHVVLLVLDSLRWDSLVAAAPVHLPRLGQIERRWSYATWTAPAHYNLLMGILPHKAPPGVHGVAWHGAELRAWGERLGLDALAVLSLGPALYLPSALRERFGYRTQAFVSLPSLNPAVPLAVGFDHYVQMPHHNDLGAILDVLELPRHQPSFTLINTGEAHYPYLLPGDPSDDAPRLAGVHGVFGRVAAGAPVPVAEAPAFFSPARLDALRQRQVRAAAALDALLPRLWAKMPDDSHLIVTSDHGELFGEGGYFGHGPVPHEKVLEVPFVEGRVGPHLRG